MNILVLNAGSSSHKFCLYALEGETPQNPPLPCWQAQLDWHPEKTSAKLTLKVARQITPGITSSGKKEEVLEGTNPEEILLKALNTL